MTTPQAYNYWLNNQLMIPEVMRAPVTPPAVPQPQQAPMQYYMPQQRPAPFGYQGDSEGGSPPGISAPYSGPGLDQLSMPSLSMPSPSKMGAGLGLLGTALSGVPGLGLAGGMLGTGVEVSNMNDMLSSMGVPGQVSYGPALGNSLSFGLFGEDAVGQGLSAVEADPAVQALADEQRGVSLSEFGGRGPSNEPTKSPHDEAGFGADGADDATIICSELYRQGYLHADWYRADAAYGAKLYRDDVYVMVGYHAWGRAVVKGMRRSAALTQVVRFLAMPVIKEIAARGGGSLFGSLIGKAALAVGMPLCRFIGRHAAKGHAAAA